MKNERILNALGGAEDKYVQEAAPVRSVKEAAFEENEAQGTAVTVTGKRRGYGGLVAAAAGLCVAVGGIMIWGVLGGNSLTEGGQSQDVDLTEGDTGQNYTDAYSTAYLSRKELYTGQWTMFMPRYMPENYRLAENTRFDVGEFGYGTIYMEFTDGNNSISYTVYTDALKYPELGDDTAFLIRDIALEDMPKLKENGWIDSGNAVVKIKVDIEQPELISDEELYRFIMSAPFSDNFDAAGIETTDLSDFIDSNYLPVVEFEPYYNVERYTLSGEVFDRSDSIVGFDGTYAYYRKWDNAEDSTTYSDIVWYNVKTGETGSLSNRDGLLYLYSDGEYVYCQKTVYGEDFSHSIVRFDVKSGKEETVLDLGNSAMLYDTIVSGNSMFIYADFLDGTGLKLLCYDMTLGVLGTEAQSVSDLPASAFTHIDTDMSSYAVTLPYKDGVIYRTLMPWSSVPEYVDDYCFILYWDGKNDLVPLFEARLANIFDGERGERLCFSDGEIVYFVHETYVNGTDAADGMQDTLCAYDLSDALAGFDFPMEHILAFNKNLNGSPYHEWHAVNAGCGGGMAAIDPYSGLIYDAENGWFTYVDTDVYYRAVRNGSSFDGIVMLEYADVEYDKNVDFVDYPEGGKDLTLCVITRK